MIIKKTAQAFRVVFLGAGRDIIKPKRRKGKIRYWFGMLDYVVLKALDRLDTRLLFDNKGVRTNRGRVRSDGERAVAKFLDKHGIRYRHEEELVLGNRTLHPDFYLPDYDAYVEYWGMAEISNIYRRSMAAKKKRYEEYRIKLISIYPRDNTRKGLEKAFQRQFKEVTGRDIPPTS